MTKRFLAAILFALPLLTFSQNTGYAGKKFILKTSLSNGKYFDFKNIEAEYVFAKHFSIGLGFRQHKADYQQGLSDRDVKYYLKEYGYGETPNGAYRPTLPNVTISSTTAKAQLKLYTGKLNTKAPRGFYFGFSYEIGPAQIDNAVALGIVLDNNNKVKDFAPQTGYRVRNIKVEMFEATMGYQEIFQGFLCLDIQFGLNKTNFNKNGVQETYLVSTLSAPYFGPNLVALGKKGDVTDTPYTSAIGLSAYIKFGFLLF